MRNPGQSGQNAKPTPGQTAKPIKNRERWLGRISDVRLVPTKSAQNGATQFSQIGMVVWRGFGSPQDRGSAPPRGFQTHREGPKPALQAAPATATLKPSAQAKRLSDHQCTTIKQHTMHSSTARTACPPTQRPAHTSPCTAAHQHHQSHAHGQASSQPHLIYAMHT